MQMPGGRMKRTATMNIYTGLLFIAVVALAVACGFMWRAGTIVGANGSPFEMHTKGSIRLAPAR